MEQLLETPRKRQRSPTSARTGPSPFYRLQAQARRLQWHSAILVGTVAILPAVISIMFAVGQLRRDTERHARHLALLIVAEAERSGAPIQRVSTLLRGDAAVGGLAGVTLLDDRGTALMRLGYPERSLGFMRTDLALPAVAAPLAVLRVEGDDVKLVTHAGRVVGIHLLVAALLAIGVYKVPMRSLRNAINEVETTHIELLHSAKLGAVGEMYAGLAHEINNPLGILLSRVRLMLGAATQRHFNAELIRDLEMIDRHGSRIAEIVRSLLAFSRKTAFELRDTDVNAVVQETVALVEKPFGKHGIKVLSALDARLPSVLGSRDHLQQVFLNLLTNARDAMPSGGTVTVRTYRDNGHVVAEVEDTGVGMPQDVAERVFEPFFTTKQREHGTGLGLSVTQSILAAHGGHVEVESEPGEGALFRVTLPVRKART
jgi:signal transduction histidine kinase